MPVFALVAASRCPRELYKSLYSAIIPKPCTAAVQAVMVAVAVSPEEVGGGGGGNTTASTPPPPVADVDISKGSRNSAHGMSRE